MSIHTSQIEASFYGNKASTLNERGLITWEIDFELRDYGVSDIFISPISLALTYDEEDSDDLIEDKELIIDFNKAPWTYKISWNLESFAIYPVSCEIDFKNHLVEIEFL